MFEGMHKVTQGSVGLGVAIGYFCSKGITVSVPLIDNQDYDLVIDEEGTLKKVQVKTTRVKVKSGNYKVQLKSVRPNRTTNIIKKFDPTTVDYLFILCDDNTKYLIPTCDIHVGGELTLTADRVQYQL